ncbi:MAG: PilZ domain-containing protein [Candidatus Eremiobacteraeota bacterium]|nr:PilZ domain-containing protein [Candidatus Eremiobacteraeota bacterium]
MTRASWIGSKTQSTEPFRRAKPPSGPSFPTMLRARGIAPAQAFVEGLTEERCVLRSVVLLDVDAPVDFDGKRADGTSYVLRGRVRSRVAVPPRFEYDVELERSMPVVAEIALDESTRQRLRLEIEFPLQYRTAKEGFRHAKARNVSTGGLLMVCREALPESTFLELHFVLPSNVLNVYPEHSTILDIRAGFKRRSILSKRRRPFGDLVVAARVVHHRGIGDGYFAYGVSFFNAEKHARAEIARFVEAVRHVKLRQKP